MPRCGRRHVAPRRRPLLGGGLRDGTGDSAGADRAAKGLEHAVAVHGDTPGPRAPPGDPKAHKRRQCILLGAAVSSGARGAVQHRRSLHLMRFCSIFPAAHEKGACMSIAVGIGTGVKNKLLAPSSLSATLPIEPGGAPPSAAA